MNLLNRFLLTFEDPTGLSRPLWRDSARYQGYQNFLIQAANGVWGHAFRMGISWGYLDRFFVQNWRESDGIIPYRTSYHVLYPDQPVESQWKHWRKYHANITGIPRVIDLELHNNTASSVIASQVWKMSELVADHDGLRPMIYSRRLLLNDWLSPHWSETQLNAHYYWLAQYRWDRIREHPGPPTRPDGIYSDRIVLHQTADKKPTPPGEAESKSIDWDRWEIGNEEEMKVWIADKWGAAEPAEPGEPQDPAYEVRLKAAEGEIVEIKGWIIKHDAPGSLTLTVKANDNFSLSVVVGHDDKGKPILEPPKPGSPDRVAIKENQLIKVQSKAEYSKKDNPNTPTIYATGLVEYFIVAPGEEGEGQFVKASKVKIVIEGLR
ncbi:GH25 family lysozyme [Chloroflexota bacterium]